MLMMFRPPRGKARSGRLSAGSGQAGPRQAAGQQAATEVHEQGAQHNGRQSSPDGLKTF